MTEHVEAVTHGGDPPTPDPVPLDPAQAFLQKGLTLALRKGFRTLAPLFGDELNAFITALSKGPINGAPRLLRTCLLHESHMNERIARVMTVEHSVEVISIMLQEEFVSLDALIKLVDLQILVEAAPQLAWKILFFGMPDDANKNSTESELLESLINMTIGGHLLTSQEIIRRLDIRVLRNVLSHEQLADVLEAFLVNEETNLPFGSKELLEIILPTLSEKCFHTLWDMLHERIAHPNGWEQRPTMIVSPSIPPVLAPPPTEKDTEPPSSDPMSSAPADDRAEPDEEAAPVSDEELVLGGWDEDADANGLDTDRKIPSAPDVSSDRPSTHPEPPPITETNLQPPSEPPPAPAESEQPEILVTGEFVASPSMFPDTNAEEAGGDDLEVLDADLLVGPDFPEEHPSDQQTSNPSISKSGLYERASLLNVLDDAASWLIFPDAKEMPIVHLRNIRMILVDNQWPREHQTARASIAYLLQLLDEETYGDAMERSDHPLISGDWTALKNILMHELEKKDPKLENRLKRATLAPPPLPQEPQETSQQKGA